MPSYRDAADAFSTAKVGIVDLESTRNGEEKGGVIEEEIKI